MFYWFKTRFAIDFSIGSNIDCSIDFSIDLYCNQKSYIYQVVLYLPMYLASVSIGLYILKQTFVGDLTDFSHGLDGQVEVFGLSTRRLTILRIFKCLNRQDCSVSG